MFKNEKKKSSSKQTFKELDDVELKGYLPARLEVQCNVCWLLVRDFEGLECGHCLCLTCFPKFVDKKPFWCFRCDKWVPVSKWEKDEIILTESDYQYFEEEAQTVKMLKEKYESEAADRAFAQTLQRELNTSSNVRRGRFSEDQYSIRNWSINREEETIGNSDRELQ